MKTNKCIVLCLLLPLWILTGCGGGGSSVSTSGPLGKLPAVVDEYSTKIEKKEAELKEVRDVNKAFSLGKDIQALKEEQVKKLEEAFMDMKPPVPIEFVQTGDKKDFVVQNFSVSKVHSGSNVVFEIKTMINMDVPSTMSFGPQFSCTFLDGKNQVIGKEWYYWLAPNDRTKGVMKGDIVTSMTGGPIDGRYAEMKKVEIKRMEPK